MARANQTWGEVRIAAELLLKLGVAVSPRLTVDEDDPSISVIDLHGRVPARVIGLVWHSDRHRSAAAEAFVDSAVAVCRDLAVEPAAA